MTLVCASEGGRGVGSVIESVAVLDKGRDLFSRRIGRDRRKGFGAKHGAAFATGAHLAVDDRLHTVVLAVYRNHEDVLAGPSSGRLERRDRTHRHFVGMAIDDVRLWVRLEERFRGLAALVTRQIAG